MERKYSVSRKRARSYAGVVARRRFAFRKGHRAYKLTKAKIGRAKYNVHMYKRWASVLQYTMSSAASASFSQQFSLDQTVNSTELTALYDQYQILGVKIRFQLINNPDSLTFVNTNAQNNPYNLFPKMWFVRDYDDVPTETVDQIKQRNNAVCKIMRPNKMISFYIRPAVRNQVYLDGITTATNPIWNTWLDCSNASVPHYGAKFAFDNNGYSNAQQFVVRAEVVYYLKFKNAR